MHCWGKSITHAYSGFASFSTLSPASAQRPATHASPLHAPRTQTHKTRSLHTPAGLTSFPSSKTSSLQSSSSCGKLSVRRITAEPVVLCVDDDEVSQLLVQQLVEPENWRCASV
eukprot:1145861-Pelagomonas_calceolata.AAC.3